MLPVIFKLFSAGAIDVDFWVRRITESVCAGRRRFEEVIDSSESSLFDEIPELDLTAICPAGVIKDPNVRRRWTEDALLAK